MSLRQGFRGQPPLTFPTRSVSLTGLCACLLSSENSMNAPADLQRYIRIFAASPGQSKARKEVDVH